VADDGRLTPSQLRAYNTVEDLCKRAAVDLKRLRDMGIPSEQDEARLMHLLQCCDTIKADDERIRTGG
jgi:hypothetical protein